MFTIVRQNLANLSNNSTQDLNKDEEEREVCKKDKTEFILGNFLLHLSSEYCDVKVFIIDIHNASLL